MSSYAREAESRGLEVIVAGAGGVGSAIAASLAAAGAGAIALHDLRDETAEALADRLRKHYPSLDVRLAGNDPAGYDLVVNGTPLGMEAGDPLPFDVARLDARTFVGEVVMKHEITPLLAAARARGCRPASATAAHGGSKSRGCTGTPGCRSRSRCSAAPSSRSIFRR